MPDRPLKATVNVAISWMTRAHTRHVLNIENQSFEFRWTEEDFLACLRQRNSIGMVAEVPGDHIAGFMVYDLEKSSLKILNFAVAPTCRRLTVGTQMIEKLVNKLSQQRRNRIYTEVRESNLGAQLFFKAVGFKATSVIPGLYEHQGCDEDAYRMEFFLNPDDEPRGLPLNRISQY